MHIRQCKKHSVSSSAHVPEKWHPTPKPLLYGVQRRCLRFCYWLLSLPLISTSFAADQRALYINIKSHWLYHFDKNLKQIRGPHCGSKSKCVYIDKKATSCFHKCAKKMTLLHLALWLTCVLHSWLATSSQLFQKIGRKLYRWDLFCLALPFHSIISPINSCSPARSHVRRFIRQ